MYLAGLEMQYYEENASVNIKFQSMITAYKRLYI